MNNQLLFVCLLWLLTPLSFSQDLSGAFITDQQPWRAFPFDNTEYRLTRSTLKRNWAHFHRATNYPFPNARYVSALLKENPALKAAMPYYKSVNQVAITLQDAWIAFFAGHFQKATRLGYSLGPIGHGVAFYAQTTYASRLEPDADKRHALWENVLERHEKYVSITRYDTMTRFFAFLSMARLSEEIAAPLVLTRGYISLMQQALLELNADEPHNIFALAARGSMDAGIVRKLGKIMGRLAYGVSPVVVEKFYHKATVQNKKIPNVHLEFAQSLLYMNGKKELPRALQHMRIASEVKPGYAMEALDVYQAKKLLDELTAINERRGYGLRDYVKRNTDMEKKYYF